MIPRIIRMRTEKTLIFRNKILMLLVKQPYYYSYPYNKIVRTCQKVRNLQDGPMLLAKQPPEQADFV